MGKKLLKEYIVSHKTSERLFERRKISFRIAKEEIIEGEDNFISFCIFKKLI